MIEGVQVLEKVAGRNTDRRGSPGGKSQDARQRSKAESLDDVEVHILMFSSRHLFRGQSVQTLCGCNSVPHCGQYRWEQLQRACHAPFDYQTSCITTVATRAATVKYRSTSTIIAISWDFQIFVPLAVTFRARCQDTLR